MTSPRPRFGEAEPDPDLATAAELITRLVFETLIGHRPPHHLTRWATLRVSEEMARHRSPAPRALRTPTPRILTAWIQRVGADHAEVGAVAHLGVRVQAIALRLGLFRGRWLCHALETTVPRP